MTAPAPGASRAPWITAAVCGVVAAALVIVYYVLLLPARDDQNIGELSGSEREAMGAATTEVVNLLAFRRSNFEADFNRALAGTTGQLTTEIKQNRAATLKAMTAGKYDMIASATGQALVGPADKAPAGTAYIVLVTVTGGRSDVPAAQIPTSVQVTVVKKGGKWLLSDLENVGIS